MFKKQVPKCCFCTYKENLLSSGLLRSTNQADDMQTMFYFQQLQEQPLLLKYPMSPRQKFSVITLNIPFLMTSTILKKEIFYTGDINGNTICGESGNIDENTTATHRSIM